MQDLTVCYIVSNAKKCGGEVKPWRDNPTSRSRICTKCGFVFFFSPAFDNIECDYHDHKTYQIDPEEQAEKAACRSGA